MTAFARELSDEFLELRDKPNFRHEPRDPGPDDFAGSALCFIATDDERLTEAARAMAKSAGALVNVADRPQISDFIMPSIVDRSPLVIAVSTGGASPILGRMLKARLETLIPAAYGRLADPDERLPRTRRGGDPVADDAPPLLGDGARGPDRGGGARRQRERGRTRISRARSSAGAERANRRGARSISSERGPAIRTSSPFARCRLMQKADVVLYDRLTDEGVMNLVRREAERIYVGKRPDNHELPQEEISALLVKLARQGKRVLRLKGGDPFVFGRGGEEIETLAEHGVPFQVCPGVTAAIGASAYAGIPLTHRDHAQACVFVTGHGKDGKIDLDWTALLQPRQTVAIYMGLRNLEALTREFIARGASADLPAAIVDNATRVNQRVIVATLGTLAAKARAAELRGPVDRDRRNGGDAARQARLVRARRERFHPRRRQTVSRPAQSDRSRRVIQGTGEPRGGFFRGSPVDFRAAGRCDVIDHCRDDILMTYSHIIIFMSYHTKIECRGSPSDPREGENVVQRIK